MYLNMPGFHIQPSFFLFLGQNLMEISLESLSVADAVSC